MPYIFRNILPEYAWLWLNMPECWTLIQHYCNGSREGRNLLYLKKCAKKNLHYFHKILYYVWEGCEYTCNPEYTSILNMDLFLNMTGSWIYQGSEYTRILNISGFQICKGFEYVRVLNISRLHRLLNVPEYPLIIPENAWLSLNISEYAWIYQHMHEYS